MAGEFFDILGGRELPGVRSGRQPWEAVDTSGSIGWKQPTVMVHGQPLNPSSSEEAFVDPFSHRREAEKFAARIDFLDALAQKELQHKLEQLEAELAAERAKAGEVSDTTVTLQSLTLVVDQRFL